MQASILNSIKQLRIIGFLEGISCIFLFFVAMPMKYLMDMPSIVTYTGWIHGILFIVFILAAIRVKFLVPFSFLWLLGAFIASLFPFGTFVLDWQLKKAYS